MDINDEKNTPFDDYNPDLAEIILTLEPLMHFGACDIPFALFDVYRRYKKKETIKEFLELYPGIECPVLPQEDPEYNEGDRYREFYMRDKSFENVGVKFGDPILIDTKRKRKSGLVCIQLGNYPLIVNASETEEKDGIVFWFPNTSFVNFYVSYKSLDRVIKFIGVPINFG